MAKATGKFTHLKQAHRAKRALLLLDKRTAEGQFAAILREELIRDQGGRERLTAARGLLIDLTIFSALMFARATRPLEEGRDLDDAARLEARDWSGELRSNLKLLGIDRATTDRAPSLAKYVEGDVE